MDNIIVRRTTLDKVELPKIVYKYREAENPYHRAILKDGKVYFSPPNGFEDEIDCKNPTRYDLLTDQEIYDEYYKRLKVRFPLRGHQYIDAQAKAWVRQGNFRDKKMIEHFETEYWDRLNKRFGVLSLTEDPANLTMWNKYSALLNGICIGFNTRTMFEEIGGGGGDVTYVDELPIIKPFMAAEIQNNLQVFNKMRKWDFEKEYRTHKTWPNDVTNKERNMQVPGKAFINVIIGERVDAALRTDIINDATKQNRNIEILTATLANGIVTIQK